MERANTFTRALAADNVHTMSEEEQLEWALNHSSEATEADAARALEEQQQLEEVLAATEADAARALEEQQQLEEALALSAAVPRPSVPAPLPVPLMFGDFDLRPFVQASQWNVELPGGGASFYHRAHDAAPWEPFAPDVCFNMLIAMIANPEGGIVQLLPAPCELRWGAVATSDLIPDAPRTRLLHVSQETGESRVVMAVPGEPIHVAVPMGSPVPPTVVVQEVVPMGEVIEAEVVAVEGVVEEEAAPSPPAAPPAEPPLSLSREPSLASRLANQRLERAAARGGGGDLGAATSNHALALGAGDPSVQALVAELEVRLQLKDAGAGHAASVDRAELLHQARMMLDMGVTRQRAVARAVDAVLLTARAGQS